MGLHSNTHTHTHPFNGPMSGTARVSRYRKGKTNLDFTEARDSGGSGISWTICKSALRSRQITTPIPHHSSFLQAGCPSYCRTSHHECHKCTEAYIIQRIGVTWMNFFTVLACVRRSVTAGCGVVRTHRAARAGLLHHDHLLRRHHRHLLRARHPPRRPEHQGQAGRRRGGPPSADHRRLPRPHQVSVHACTVGRQQW